MTDHWIDDETSHSGPILTIKVSANSVDGWTFELMQAAALVVQTWIETDVMDADGPGCVVSVSRKDPSTTSRAVRKLQCPMCDGEITAFSPPPREDIFIRCDSCNAEWDFDGTPHPDQPDGDDR